MLNRVSEWGGGAVGRTRRSAQTPIGDRWTLSLLFRSVLRPRWAFGCRWGDDFWRWLTVGEAPAHASDREQGLLFFAAVIHAFFLCARLLRGSPQLFDLVAQQGGPLILERDCGLLHYC